MSYNRKTNLYEGYIYKVTNLINGRLYIGQTSTTVNKRWEQHCNVKLKSTTTLFDRKIKEYGKENFKVEAIKKYIASTKEELKEILNKEEIKYIKDFNSIIPKFGGNGYNVDEGGWSCNWAGVPIDVYNMDGELICEFQSKTEVYEKLGIHPRTVYDIAYGIDGNYKCLCVFRLHGDPFDKYDVTSSYYKEIYQFTLDGYLIDKYYSCDQVKQKYGLTFVGEILDNPHRTAGGYWWGSTNVFNYQGEEKKPTKQICQYDLWGNLLNTYYSLSECSRQTGYVNNAITNNCIGKTSTLDKFIFRYKDDSFEKYDYKFKEDICKELLCWYYPVNKYTLDGKYVASYSSIHDVVKGTNRGCVDLYDCVLHKRTSLLGYIWRFDFDNNILESSPKIPPIDVYTLDGIFIKYIFDYEQFIEFFGVYNSGSIYSVLKGTGYYKGYIIVNHGEPYIKYNNWRTPVDVYSVDGTLIKKFNSIAEGAKYFDKSKGYQTTIKNCINGVQLISEKKYVWRYKDHPFDEFPLNKRYCTTKVNCYTTDNDWINTFKSLTDAGVFANRSIDSVTQCCQHRSKTCGGYHFYYADDPNQPDKTKIISK